MAHAIPITINGNRIGYSTNAPQQQQACVLISVNNTRIIAKRVQAAIWSCYVTTIIL
jgi:hypothetical protein